MEFGILESCLHRSQHLLMSPCAMVMLDITLQQKRTGLLVLAQRWMRHGGKSHMTVSTYMARRVG